MLISSYPRRRATIACEVGRVIKVMLTTRTVEAANQNAMEANHPASLARYN
jgi:hypothetical protein